MKNLMHGELGELLPIYQRSGMLLWLVFLRKIMEFLNNLRELIERAMRFKQVLVVTVTRERERRGL